MIGWQDKGLTEPWRCPLCRSKGGGHRQCLCDLTVTTWLIDQPCTETDRVEQLAGLVAHPMSLASLRGHIPARQQCFIRPYISGSLRQTQGPYYLHYNAPTWTSNTFLWLDGSIMQSRGPFRSITWALLFMTCFRCKRISSSVIWNAD